LIDISNLGYLSSVVPQLILGLSFPFLLVVVLNKETGDHVTGPASYDTIKLPEHNSRWVPQLQKGIGQCEQHFHHLHFAASNPPTHWSIHPWIHQNLTNKKLFLQSINPMLHPSSLPHITSHSIQALNTHINSSTSVEEATARLEMSFMPACCKI